MALSDHSSSFSRLLSLLESGADAQRLCGRIAAAGQGMVYAGHELDVHKVSLQRVPPGKRRMVPHAHSYYEALFFLAGGARENAGFRGDLVPGTMQLHVPGARHGWEVPGENLPVRFGVAFTLKPPVTLRPCRNWPCVPELAEDLDVLFREATNTDPGAASRLHARFLLVLSRFFALLKWPHSQADELRLHERPLAETVELFLRDNLGQPLSLDDVALVVYTSVPTLNRRYREETGHSVMERFNTLRMAEAARLLRETDLTVKEVGARIGFADASYFCRRFRRVYNCSPGDFRAQSESGGGST